MGREYRVFLYNNEVTHAYLHPFYLEIMSEELSKYDKIYLKVLIITLFIAQYIRNVKIGNNSN